MALRSALALLCPGVAAVCGGTAPLAEDTRAPFAAIKTAFIASDTSSGENPCPIPRRREAKAKNAFDLADGLVSALEAADAANSSLVLRPIAATRRTFIVLHS